MVGLALLLAAVLVQREGLWTASSYAIAGSWASFFLGCAGRVWTERQR